MKFKARTFYNSVFALRPVCRALFLAALAACAGEDRSGEMPRVPVVETSGARAAGNSCEMTGSVGESHNSSLRECGFVLWPDSGKALKLKCDTNKVFSAVADSLSGGLYHYAAYARNGMGTSYGDTLTFTIEASGKQNAVYGKR